mgnify:CR=1 FL=1
MAYWKEKLCEGGSRGKMIFVKMYSRNIIYHLSNPDERGVNLVEGLNRHLGPRMAMIYDHCESSNVHTKIHHQDHIFLKSTSAI